MCDKVELEFRDLVRIAAWAKRLADVDLYWLDGCDYETKIRVDRVILVRKNLMEE